MINQKNRFDGVGMKQVKFTESEYDQYSFMICNFAEADLSNIKFTDCEFVNCNFALTNLTNTALRECIFIDCKFSGIHFDNCKDLLFEVSFYKLPSQSLLLLPEVIKSYAV
jgi:fluoroquinolone resistance protein